MHVHVLWGRIPVLALRDPTNFRTVAIKLGARCRGLFLIALFQGGVNIIIAQAIKCYRASVPIPPGHIHGTHQSDGYTYIQKKKKKNNPCLL